MNDGTKFDRLSPVEKNFQSVLKKVGSLPFGNASLLKKVDSINAANSLSVSARLNYVRTIYWLLQKKPKPLKKITKQDLIDFFADLNGNYSPSTINTYKVLIKSFFKQLYESKEYPPLVEWIKCKRRSNDKVLPQDVWKAEEIKKLVNSAKSLRDKAIIMFMFESCARVGELIGLHIKDIEFDQYGARAMVKGKTGMRKIRLIDSMPYLQQWLEIHPHKNNHASYLWINTGKRDYGKPLGQDGVSTILKNTQKISGVQKRIYAHLMRHSGLTEKAKYMTEQELKIFAGWTGNSDMPQVYIHLSGKDVDRKILKMHGLLKESEEEQSAKDLSPRNCPRCKTKNSATSKYCTNCSMILDLQTASQIAETKEKDEQAVVTLMNEMHSMKKEMHEMFEEMNRTRGNKYE